MRLFHTVAGEGYNMIWHANINVPVPVGLGFAVSHKDNQSRLHSRNAEGGFSITGVCLLYETIE